MARKSKSTFTSLILIVLAFLFLYGITIIKNPYYFWIAIIAFFVLFESGTGLLGDARNYHRRNYHRRIYHRHNYYKNYNDDTDSETYIDENGYRRFSNSGTLVSRWAAEEKLGRRLRDDEVVHHINRNKLDNNPSNLWVFSNQDEHEAAHEEDGDFDDDDDDDF